MKQQKIVFVVSLFILIVLVIGIANAGKSGAPKVKPQCSDGIDNDGDLLVDYPSDPGCTSSGDNYELETLVRPPPPRPLE